jgi:hypothetical protein
MKMYSDVGTMLPQLKPNNANTKKSEEFRNIEGRYR